MLVELRKEKGGRSSSMVANLIVHAGDMAITAAQPSQLAAVSGGLRLRDGPVDPAAAWRSSPESSSKRQSRSQQPSQVRLFAVHVEAPMFLQLSMVCRSSCGAGQLPMSSRAMSADSTCFCAVATACSAGNSQQCATVRSARRAASAPARAAHDVHTCRGRRPHQGSP